MSGGGSSPELAAGSWQPRCNPRRSAPSPASRAGSPTMRLPPITAVRAANGPAAADETSLDLAYAGCVLGLLVVGSKRNDSRKSQDESGLITDLAVVLVPAAEVVCCSTRSPWLS